MTTLALTQRWKTRVVAFWQEDATVFLQGTTIYLLSFLILAVIIFATPAFFSTDDYYHARISEQIILQRRLALDFPWLPLTILSPDKYVDHHLLLHIALAPGFYFWGMTGAKIVIVALAAGIFLASWLLFREIGVKYPTLWTLGLFGVGPTFIFRMLMIRTQGMSMMLLVVGLLFLFNRRYIWLILIAFLYTWLYNGFILILVFAGAYTIAQYIADRKLEWQPFVYTALGIALGLVINPYFPRNILFVLDHLGAKVDLESSVTLGAEWNPFNTRTLIRNFSGTMLAIVLGFVRPIFGGKRDRVEITLMFCALITGFMAFNSMRFFEYWPGFALLFSAAAWGRDVAFEIKLPSFQRYKRYVVPAFLTLVMLYFVGTNLEYTWRLAKQTRDMREYEGAANWLELNTAPGTIVFTVGFNDFSRLFFYNQQNTYLIGLDPTYLQYANPRLWNDYSRIINGNEENIAGYMARAFGMQYAVSGVRHGGFNDKARNDPNLELVFRDRYNYVWRVRDAYFQQVRQSQ